MEKRDAHIHTPFCPHGSKDALKEYVEKALERGFDSITFTEHAPFLRHFKIPYRFRTARWISDRWRFIWSGCHS